VQTSTERQSVPVPESGAADLHGEPWQLRMFRRSLKKQQKLQALLSMLGEVADQRCLLVTCGDNNGALNWHFREQGGTWTWADLSEDNLETMASLLGEPIEHLVGDTLPFSEGQFDVVVCIDVLEHLSGDQPFLSQLYRVLKPGGRLVVTVPNGDSRLWANRIKWLVGMRPHIYGHTRAGYTLAELRESVGHARLEPIREGSYSGFFTEMIELVLNYGYVFVLARKKEVAHGHIAPTSSGELRQHGAAYRIYSLAYPLMRRLSQLDRLLPATTYHAVVVVAQKRALKDGWECVS
jgi:SAM-dependent methyltransferase